MFLGRDGSKNFWCGFCNTPVATDEVAEQARSDVGDGVKFHAPLKLRAMHILKHYHEQNLCFGDWICVAHNKRKDLITEEERKRAEARLEQQRVDVESDIDEVSDHRCQASCMKAKIFR